MPKDTVRTQNEENEELMAVAAQVKPLPANVVPSEIFIRHMRKRLLELQPKDSSGRAA